MTNKIKQCPYCGEDININAQKCKHCGEWLTEKEDGIKENTKIIQTKKSFSTTLAFAFFFGIFGVHRFYTGHKAIGFTLLGLTIILIGIPISGIWALVDTISICLNKYKDINNNYLENYSKTWGIIICIITILSFLCSAVNFVIGFSNTETNNEINTSNGVTENKPDLEVIEHHMCNDEFGNKAVCGVIQNNTNKKYSYAQIGINFYDKDGVQVGNSFDNANDVEPHGKLKFSVMLQGDNIESYKIMDITGY